MNVIPHYKVIGPYDIDWIIHNIKKNYAKRQDAFDFKDKNLCNSLK